MPIYMKIEGLDGESQNDHYRGWFEVYSYSWGETQSTNHAGGGGAGVGKVSFSDLSLMKSTGKSSSKLFFTCASGRHIPAVQIEITTNRGENEELYLRYKLTDVLISSYQVSGDGGSTPTESLSLNFTKIEYMQRHFLPNGQAQEETNYWDIRRNQGG